MVENANAGRVISPPKNVATRCYSFASGLQTNAASTVGAAFGFTLGLIDYESGNAEHADLVRMAIRLFRQQHNSILKHLNQATTVAPQLFQSITAATAELARVETLNQAFRDFHFLSSPIYLTELGWCGVYLGDTDEQVSFTELADLLRQIAELKFSISTLNLPPEIENFASALLADLESGIVATTFEGTGTAHRTFRRAVSDIEHATERFSTADSPPLTTEQQSWLKRLAEKVDQVGKISASVKSTAEAIEAAKPYVAQFIEFVSK